MRKVFNRPACLRPELQSYLSLVLGTIPIALMFDLPAGCEESEKSDDIHSGPDLSCRSKDPLHCQITCPYYCNAIRLENDGNKGLVLLCKQQAVGQQAGPANEGLLGRDSSQFRKIIIFR
jgi:hypothetical protein